jgi:hypothetical protein
MHTACQHEALIECVGVRVVLPEPVEQVVLIDPLARLCPIWRNAIRMAFGAAMFMAGVPRILYP